MKKLLPQVLVVALGVIVAGYIMYMGRDVALIKNASNGFDV